MEDRRDARRAKNDLAGSGTLGRPRLHPTGEPIRQREPLPTRVGGLPPLAPDFHAALDAGLGALALALDPAQRRAIEDHVRLLLAWNQVINLTSITDPAEVAVRHVVDSLTAVGLLRERGIDRVLDLGSGGGFPGIPLAVAVPLRRALLVESVGKKARFLSAAVNAVGLDGVVAVAADRVEGVAAGPEGRGWPAVTARAVGPLAELVELAFPLLAPGGSLIAWKRGEIAAELTAASRAAAALGAGTFETLAVRVPGLDGHCLVVATPGGPVPSGFPRNPRVRTRRPW